VENRSRPEIRTHSRMSMGWTRCPYPDNSESGSLNVSRNKLVRPSLKTLVQGPDNDSELPQLFLFCSALVLLQFQRFRWAIKLVRQVLRLWSPTTLSPNLVERKRELLRCVKEKKPILPWMKIIARVNSKKARLARKDSRDENPNSNFPPPTDHGNIEPVWCSFDLTHKRVQGGGWTNQATQRELVPSKDIAGVRMRLTAGSFRELHWRTADEWVFVLYGNARVTVLNPDGTIFIGDVGKGDLWYFPAGFPHSIQGLGPDGTEFMLVFDQGSFSEDNTFLLSDWLASSRKGSTHHCKFVTPKGDRC
jgi:mannose-6-phosphate isomerase-like protein (cupin superfamily)